MESIASRLEAIAGRLEAVASKIQLLEELHSARVAYQFLHDEYNCLHAGYSQLYLRSEEEFAQMSSYNRSRQEHLQEMMQEDINFCLPEEQRRAKM